MLQNGDRVRVDLRTKFFQSPEWKTGTFMRFQKEDRMGNTAVVKLDEAHSGCPQVTYLADQEVVCACHSAYLKRV